MSDPTEDHWAAARRVLARRTPDSDLVVNRYGAAIVGPGGRTACGPLPEIDEGDGDVPRV